MSCEVLSVSEVSNIIKSKIDNIVVSVRGEVSNLLLPSSGHTYFTLKDSKAVIQAISWRSINLKIKLEDGMLVVCHGKLTTYHSRSQYQIIVTSVEYDGIGALSQILEKRRLKLASEGLFDTSRKKPIPKIPNSIGVITSLSGAVVRDILHRIESRFPCLVVIRDVVVQGREAASAIISAIAEFNKDRNVDVIIIARGGGTLEDIWVFNEESVVRQVADSDLPIISAIGHETDITLTDCAADLRAPTPSAAAELATPSRDEVERWLNSYCAHIRHLCRSRYNTSERSLMLLINMIMVFDRRLSILLHSLHNLLSRMTMCINAVYRQTVHSLRFCEVGTITRIYQNYNDNIDSNMRVVNSLSCNKVMSRGFVVVRRGGVPVFRADQLSVGEDVVLEFFDNQVSATITSTNNNS